MKHGLLAFAALVLATTGHAELPEGDLTGQWSTIRFLHEHGEGRISGSGLALIRDIYQRASDEVHDTYAREIVALCKRPQDLRNGGQEGLVRFFERLDKQQDDVQLQALERIYDNLSPEDRKALDALIEEDRKSISRLGGNTVDAVRSGELTVEQVIERTCKPEILEQLQRSKESNSPRK
jgi:hypothetical protein